MKLEDGHDIEIERAHRTPGRRPASPYQGNDPKKARPRPIHCRLLRFTDRQHILKQAPSALRNNPYKGSHIFISDDVTSNIRNARKQLRENHLPGIHHDARAQFAFIPWSVPAVITYKLHSGTFKSFRLGDASLSTK